MRLALLFLLHITPIKIYNFIGCGVKILYAKLFKKIIKRFVPWSVSVETINFCNLKCKACPTGKGQLKRDKHILDFETYKIYINKIEKTTLNLFLYFQGEPLLNKDFTRMSEYARKKNLFCCTSTNAQLLDIKTSREIVLSKLDKIIISMDGFDQESYQKYRKGGQFLKVTQGINNLRTMRKKLHSLSPFIEVQCLITKYNETHLEEIKKIAIKAGGDAIKFKTMQLSPENLENDFEEFSPSDPRYCRYKKTDGEIKLTKRVEFCKRLINSCVIDCRGEIVPCCYDKDSEFSFGNISSAIRINDIVNDDNSINFLKKIIIEKKYEKMCNNCGG